MVAPLISYDVDQDDRFRDFLSDVTSKVKDLSFSMGETARIIKKESTANFILKGYGKYPDLSDIYAARKKRLAPGTPILTGLKSGGGVSGKLKRSIINTTSDSILKIGKLSLLVGTKAKSKKGKPYPTYVQEGTAANPETGKGGMPARKFLFLTKKMVDRIINTIDNEIIEVWKNG